MGGPTPSFQNKVVTTNFGNSVIDNGTNNELLGTQNPPKSFVVSGLTGEAYIVGLRLQAALLN